MPTKSNIAALRLAQGNYVKPTPDEMRAAKFTALQLAEWGIPWPPPSGWRESLTDQWEESVGIDDGLLRCGGCGQQTSAIMVTAGGREDGTIEVYAFCSTACACSLGFDWVGRDNSAAFRAENTERD